MNSSSSADRQTRRVALERLHAHPLNPNVMPAEVRAKLARHIERTGLYPPLIVMPDPDDVGEYRLLDGHQRAQVLADLGHEQA